MLPPLRAHAFACSTGWVRGRDVVEAKLKRYSEARARSRVAEGGMLEQRRATKLSTASDGGTHPWAHLLCELGQPLLSKLRRKSHGLGCRCPFGLRPNWH
jgi:hypothetical protein